MGSHKAYLDMNNGLRGFFWWVLDHCAACFGVSGRALRKWQDLRASVASGLGFWF